MMSKGEARKIAARLYTTDMQSRPEEIVRAELLEIIRHFHPGAVVSYRTAIEGKPSPAGQYHVTWGGRDQVRELPGVTLRIWAGPSALPGDTPIGRELFIASRARAFLENLTPSRARSTAERKTLDRPELEAWLDRLSRVHGVEELRHLARDAEGLSVAMRATREMKSARALVAALTGQGDPKALVSPLARARARREPFDPDRVALFGRVATRLAAEPIAAAPDRPPPERRLHAFWESYFSNYIEGTIFTIDEAREIVFDHKLPAARPKDAHDILATFRLATDPAVSRTVPRSADNLVSLLQERHRQLMQDRPEVGPGRFKESANRVGSREFVAPELVRGTLRQAFEIGRDLKSPLARGAFVMFAVAEVHPFNDGNGRLARLFLNAELSSAGCGRLIVPTSLRTDYLSCLEALTVNGNPEPYIRLLPRLVTFSQSFPCSSWTESAAALEKSGALKEAPAGLVLGSSMFPETSTKRRTAARKRPPRLHL